jgi:hypothetical protein
MILIGVEGGAKSKIGEARFWVRSLAISPPKILSFEESVPHCNNILKKKLARTLGPDPLVSVK